MMFPTFPTATHNPAPEPSWPYAIPLPTFKTFPRPVHATASVDVANPFPAVPTTTHKPAPEPSCPYAIPYP